MTILQLDTWRSLFSEDECNFDEVSKYLDFINEAIEKYDPERYSEWHHILPKCIDLEKKFLDQGVRINGRDHFLAHQMLVECFTKNKYRRKLSSAFCYLSGNPKIPLTPEEYEETRSLRKEAWKGVSREGQNDGKVWINNGDVEKFIPVTSFDSYSSQGFVRGRLKKMYSPEYRQMMSRLKKRDNLSPETRDKLRVSHLGERNSNYGGKSFTEETRKKISESKQGFKFTYVRHYSLTCRNCQRVFDSICPSSKYCELCKRRLVK